MAFVSRGDRNLDFARKDHKNLGPGAYLGHSDFKPKLITNAPFSSKSERYLHGGGTFAPGPGQYAQVGQFEHLVKKNDQEGKNATMSGELGIFAFLKSQPIGFTSGANRFKEDAQKQLSPGPGSYNPQKELQKNKIKGESKAEWQQMAMVRLPNAPSIPSHNNIFGYEETPNGELIQQQNPEKVFTGEGKDRIGPGHYETKSAPLQKKSGTNWHSSKVNRFTFGGMKGAMGQIGPGSYEPGKKMETTQYKKKGTSCFVSAVPKSTGFKEMDEYKRKLRSSESDDEEDEEIEDAIPGPGTYNPRNMSSFEPRYIPASVQQFGATAPRFAGSRTAMGSTLGPGQYGDFRQAYKVQKKKTSVPFLSSDKKAEDKKIFTEVPGPGQYPAKGIKEELNKKVWGKQGAFGSTERRFAQLSSMKTPGPGIYNADLAIKNHDNKSASEGPSRMFKQPLKLSKKRPDVIPAVGDYDQSINTIQSNLQRKKEKYASNPLLANIRLNRGDTNKKNERFLGQKEDEHGQYLGPGCYELPREFDHNLMDTKGNLFVAKDKRFKNEMKASPGPGQYSNEEVNPWNKRTYNLLFSNEQ